MHLKSIMETIYWLGMSGSPPTPILHVKGLKCLILRCFTIAPSFEIPAMACTAKHHIQILLSVSLFQNWQWQGVDQSMGIR